ncbi:2OG-Fe(II) oxygenase [Pseudorhodoferax sp. Leaf265]|jgi:prolyl 4-hydroxylase|uniref:2OG-Fe(II) oxygenase n=1 Tax=Pseudorhodoferax sp. Leaf265 TaxID=1736315 RepID=UPI0006F5D40A|nr:2OG-Fe(II) oxygenase [Pseudorhodoferax sp. Leaf265]KQP17567.1 proline dioxygenase [Pseudorhodoferax sp. Leaf265]PZP91789.1 MAG: 2-oxoglutarate-dependent dioxygenase [Variovorax paradoxus]PZQ01799.1 MAG: 2-oxoglutarate-dependent dioxygenase [Variovorax paradoxus]
MSANAPTQAITPQLRQWIVEQAQAGHAAEVVLQAMRDAGWEEDVAIEALENTLREHLEQNAVAAGLPPATTVPEPALDDSPLYLQAEDRRVHVLSAQLQPRIVVFGGLLSDAECEALIDLASPRMARSRTVATKTGGEEINVDRTSDGMFFQRGETELIERIEARIAALLRWPLENGEGLQILRYGPGAEYKPHYDYFDPAEPGTPSILKRGGQRVGTLVMYLGEPERGGGTVFPDVHLEVAPKRGNAVFFSYDRPHPSTRTLHGGSPVLAGEKWIATKWLREREFA